MRGILVWIPLAVALLLDSLFLLYGGSGTLPALMAAHLVLGGIAAWVSARRMNVRALKPMLRLYQDSSESPVPGFESNNAHSGNSELGTRNSKDANALAEIVACRWQMLLAECRELSRVRHRLETVFNNMVEGVVLLDGSFRVLFVNPAFRSILGVRDALTGKSLIEGIRNAELNRLLQRVEANRTVILEELPVFSPTFKELQVCIVPAASHGDSTAEFVIVVHDVTELRKLERMRSDFVANVSHELRTPLASIQGYTETLLDGAMNDPVTARKFLEVLQRQATFLSNLVTDLLRLSRIESHEGNFLPHAVDLKKLVQRVLVGFEAAFESRAMIAAVEIPDGVIVQGDEDLLAQVFNNLVDNAVKYSNEGGSVRIATYPHGDELQVDVSDTGIGIPREALPRIFERFYRVDRSRSRELGGTGLGLAICKHIVQRHGGKIWATSEGLGKGTRFTFTLPVA